MPAERRSALHWGGWEPEAGAGSVCPALGSVGGTYFLGRVLAGLGWVQSLEGVGSCSGEGSCLVLGWAWVDGAREAGWSVLRVWATGWSLE